MFKIIIMAMCLSVSLISADTSAKPLVYVQKDMITEFDLEQRIKVLHLQLPPEAYKGMSEETFKAQVLDQMIGDFIQWQEANRLGIKVSDQEINQAMTRIFRGDDSRVSQFKTSLSQVGVSWKEFKNQFRQEIAVAKLHQNLFGSQIKITDQDVKLYMQDHQFDRDRFKITSVIFPKPGFKFSTVNKLRQEWMKSDMDFPSGASVNHLDYRMYHDFPGSIQKKLTALKSNQVSDVIFSGNNMILVKLYDHQYGAKLSENEVKNELYQLQFSALFKPWYDDLLKRTYIKKNN